MTGAAKNRCGWIETLPPREGSAKLDGDVSADFAIVGAGYTGLSAARRLAELRPDAEIVILEGSRVGDGSAGRNSGFVLELPHYQPALGVEGNRTLLEIARAGKQSLADLIEKHGIDCEWHDEGVLHTAVGGRGKKCLAHLREGLSELGVGFDNLGREEIREITGTARYSEAVKTGGALVQPAQLVRGLAASLPENAKLFEETPVTKTELGRIHTPRGVVTAKKNLIATNAFIPALGFLRGRVVPMLTFASLTRTMTEPEISALGGETQWGIVAEERMGPTIRRTGDNRILVRGGVRYRPDMKLAENELARFREEHERALRSRFPQLPELGFEYSWNGLIAMSFNNGQFLGELAPNVFASVCYNGVGIALGTGCGKLLAEMSLGVDSKPLSEFRSLPKPMYLPGMLAAIGVPLTVGTLKFLGREEL